MKTTKKMTKKEKELLLDDLKSVCLIYADFKDVNRQISFGHKMFERLSQNIDFDSLSENEIIYKGAQWGGKWGNFYKAIFYRNGEFHLGSGFSTKQILS